MNDKTIAVDAMNTLYQFLSIIRQPDGTPLKDSQGRVTSHLSGLFYRTVKLFENNIEVVYVYDGESPELKATESAERRKRREQAREEWKRLKEEGKLKKAYQKATQSAEIDGDMIKESKKLLDAMGVPYVQAPSEGEAQAARMNVDGGAWAVGSQDWDSLLFGADRMVKNLTTTGRRKVPGKETYREVIPERIDRDTVLDELGITQDQLIWLGILMGTDYNPGGIHGIGPKKGIDLVRKYNGFEDLKQDEKWDWDHDADPDVIRDFFQDPPVADDITVAFDDPDEDRIRDVLVDEHDFSEDRINSTLDTFIDARQDRQKGLDSFV
jgi:flap endonuclease-1